MSELITRKAEFGAADLKNRTVPVVISTGAPVKRWDDIVEVLDLAKVDLSRGNLPLIECHDAGKVNIGQVRDIRVHEGKLRGAAVFGMSERATELLVDVNSGIVTGVSIGYRHTDKGTPVKLADGTSALSFGFQPHEVSIVPVPADIGAGFHRSLPANTMTAATSTAAAPVAIDRATVETLCRGLPAGFADALIASGADLETVRRAAVNELARRDAAAGGHVNVAPAATLRRDDKPGMLRSMEDALAARLHVRGIDLAGNPYKTASLRDMMRDCLERAGRRTTDMSTDALVRAGMHTVGDFSTLLAATGNRVLAERYGAFNGGLRRIARQTMARDFRAKTRIRLGEAPTLELVNENGEFTYGSRAETKESYSLRTFGRIFSISRQAIVNDDLGAFEDVLTAFAQSAYNRENAELVTLLTSNAGVGPTMDDGKALFHTDHGNLATGAGSALQTSSLVTARKQLRLMKGLDGRTPIDVEPKYLVVPAALEQTALQLTSTAYQPATQSAVDPWAGRLGVIVDPRLDSTSTTAWYLAAAPEFGTLEYSYLEGASGPQVDMDHGFEIDGIAYRCKLDFGAGVVDWRGLFRAVGA